VIQEGCCIVYGMWCEWGQHHSPPVAENAHVIFSGSPVRHCMPEIRVIAFVARSERVMFKWARTLRSRVWISYGACLFIRVISAFILYVGREFAVGRNPVQAVLPTANMNHILRY
jgi:hypothetical protein